MKFAAARLGASALAAAAVLAVTGCGIGSSDPLAAATPVSATPTTEPLGTPSRAADPTAPATPVAVKRSGAATKPAVAGVSADLRSKATYSDGLAVQVTKIGYSVNTDRGPGALTGEQLTTFTFTVTNNSGKPVALDQVVVAAAYGSPKRVAAPVYTATSRDLAGSLAPGATATAGYSFAIPVAQRSAVRLTVDLDGVHGLAVLTGAAG